MKAIYFSEHSKMKTLLYGDIPMPTMHEDEVLIKVHATAITRDELTRPSTFQTTTGCPRHYPIVLGHEFSGVVESVGSLVESVKIGDDVYGITDWCANGAQAEYCVAPAISIARKPRLIDHVQASIVPIPALAAWHGLFEISQLQYGQRALVHGADRSVGFYAVQIARWRGAHVTATASSTFCKTLRLLGADAIKDNRNDPYDSLVKDCDVVFDCVGSDALEKAFDGTNHGGRFVTMANNSSRPEEERVWDAITHKRSVASQLSQIGHLIDSGDIRANVGTVYSLPQSRNIYSRPSRRMRLGEISVRVSD